MEISDFGMACFSREAWENKKYQGTAIYAINTICFPWDSFFSGLYPLYFFFTDYFLFSFFFSVDYISLFL
jgi:hypothetical protein